MRPDARCLDCGYLLRGLAEARCPECGRGFSADDSNTVNCGRPYGRFVRWALRPTVGIAPFSYWVAWGLFLIAATLLFERRWPTVIYALFWILFLLPYAVHGTIRNLAVRAYRQPRTIRRIDRRNVRKILTAFSVPFVLMLLGLPLHIPFYLSLPWINTVARHAWQGGPSGPYPPPQWAGCYRVTIVDVKPRCVTAKIAGLYLLFYADEWRHLPGWSINDDPDEAPIGGGWYRWDDGTPTMGW